jgi:hypothetical protein
MSPLMRGYQQPSIRPVTTDPQTAFRSLSRHRRSKLARAAQTTLVKAHQWGRGEAVPSATASALEGAVKALQAKGPKT